MADITLHGGPWNGEKVDPRPWTGGPRIEMVTHRVGDGALEIGVAIYEKNQGEAFWLENRWEESQIEH